MPLLASETESGSPPETSAGTAARPFPSIWQAIGLVLLLTLGLTLIPATLRILFERIGIEVDSLVLGLLGNGLAFALVLPLGALQTGLPLRRLFPLRPVGARLWPAMLMVLVGWIVVAAKLDLIVQRILPVPEELLEMFNELFAGDRNPYAQLFLLAVLAPLTEELFFRGVLLQGFRRRYPIRTAVLASALLFAVTHANPWQFLPTLVLGIYFGWWCLRTGSLWPALAGHAFHNAALWFAARAQAQAAQMGMVPPDIPLHPTAVDVFGITLMIAGTTYLTRTFKN